MSTPTRPVLRYHGGKWRLAPWIMAHFPRHRCYVEPFGGAGSVLLRKPRSYVEVYNDLDGEVVNLFRVLRDPKTAGELERQLRLTPFAREEFVAAYTPAADPVERARRTIIRAYMGYGSASFNSRHATGFRNYTRGQRNRLPVRDWQHYPDQIAAYVERLAGVVVESRPAVEVIRQHDGRQTLFYVDPPYPLATRGSAKVVRQKYTVEMTDDDHRALADVLRNVKGMVILSGYPCDLYDRELYPDWYRVTKDALADGAKKTTEVLWMNDAAARHQQASLFDGGVA